MSIPELEQKYEGLGYGALKKDLLEVVSSSLSSIQQRYNEIRNSDEIRNVLKEGAAKAEQVAAQTVRRVKEKMGFVLL
jgi:tryptophanyl-tRNA synthetase